MLNKLSKKVKIIIFIAIIVLGAWIFVIQPLITFHNNEKKMETSARRSYELNSRELPTGERVKTLSLQKLYDGGLLEEDFFIPLTKKTCSNENSWVKVRKENGEYKYYVYLECGHYKSNIDHEGPVIKLKGSSEIILDKGEEYKELGVESVKDAVDGELKVSDVTIKGKVDTSIIGSYDVEYIAFDNMSNKTVVTRKVKVVRRLYKEVSDKLKGAKNFTGLPTDNFLRLSNIVFRIYGVDENNNVIIVTDRDIANVNHTKIDKWLEYFYKNLNKNTQKMIVKSKYCSMTVDEKSLNKTECDSYTDEKKIYIPSIVDVNKAKSGDSNFMKLFTMSWVAEKKNDKEAYLHRNTSFFLEDDNLDYYVYPSIENYGVRPMMKIKGSSLIVSGTGEKNNPYTFGDTKKAKGSDLLNTREVGEFVTDTNTIWRIVKIMEDGTTKVVSEESLYGNKTELLSKAGFENGLVTYNPTKRGTAAYYINNKATAYFDVSKFENHEILVPIYKNDIVYGEEIETKKYKAVLSSPDMYEMFSAAPESRGSYWLVNSTKKKYITGSISDIGVPFNYELDDYYELSARPVGYYKKDIVITSGKGTLENPYMIK